jgi:hypothetical protein
MRLRVSADERYPHYFLADPAQKFTRGPVIEISDEEWAAYNAACDEYGKWQGRLADRAWLSRHGSKEEP